MIKLSGPLTTEQIAFIEEACNMAFEALKWDETIFALVTRRKDGTFGFFSKGPMRVEDIRNFCLDLLRDLNKPGEAVIHSPTGEVFKEKL